MSDNLLPNLLEGFNQGLLDKLHLGQKTAKHPVLRGDASEDAWIDLMKTYLPRRYDVDKGIVVDSEGKVSDQIDLIIYDRQYSPFIFKTDTARYIPAESVYAAFEVKQSMDRDKILYAHKKLASVRALKRTSLPVPNVVNGKSEPKPLHHILGGFLCLNTEWKPPFGQPFEKVMAEAMPDQIVNLVCVAQTGMYEMDETSQTMTISDKAVTMFFFRLLSILQQKATVPMIDIMAYAKWLHSKRTAAAE